MTIVPIGKLVLQEVEGQEREEYLQGLISELQVTVKTVVTRCVEAELEREVTQALKRKAHGQLRKKPALSTAVETAWLEAGFFRSNLVINCSKDQQSRMQKR